MTFMWLSIDLVKFTSVFVLVTWCKGFESLLLNMITNDSLFSALDVIIEAVLNSNQRKEYVKIVNNHGIIDRYIYYGVSSLLVSLLNILTWWQLTPALYWIVMMSSCPIIMNWLLATPYFADIRDIVLKPCLKMGGFVLCNSVAYIINTICNVVLHVDPEVSYKEVARAIKHQDHIRLIDLVKSFAIATLVNYLEGTKSYYGWILNILYRYGIIIRLENISEQVRNLKARERLRMIVNRRQWDMFYHPEILRSAIALYSRTDKSHIITKIRETISILEENTVRFFAIYTIGALTPSHRWIVISIISYTFLLSKCVYKGNPVTIYQIIARAVITIFAAVNGGIILESALIEFADLLENRAIAWVIDKIKCWASQNLWLLYHRNDNNSVIIRCIILTITVGYFVDGWRAAIIVNASLLISATPDLLSWFTIMGIFSHYNPIHMVLLGVSVYIYLNLANIGQISQRPIRLDIIDDYTETSTVATYIHDNNPPVEIDSTGEPAELIILQSLLSKNKPGLGDDFISL